jgi:hypothetical protein
MLTRAPPVDVHILARLELVAGIVVPDFVSDREESKDAGPLCAGALALSLLAIAGSFMVSHGSAKAEAYGVPAPGGVLRRASRASLLAGGTPFVPIAKVIARPFSAPARCVPGGADGTERERPLGLPEEVGGAVRRLPQTRSGRRASARR